MGKLRVQVSSDRGKTWKYRWVDQKEFDPDMSSLRPGDYVRPPKGDVLVVGLREGKLTTSPIALHAMSLYNYEITGRRFQIEAATQSEADHFLIYELIQSGILRRLETSANGEEAGI